MKHAQKVARMAVMALCAAGAAWILWTVRHGLYPFVLALVLAYILNPAVNTLERRGLGRGAAILVLYAIVLGLGALAAFRLLPLLIHELEQFALELPEISRRVEDLSLAAQRQVQDSSLPYSLRVALDDSAIAIEGAAQRFVRGTVSGLISLVGYSLGLAISPVLAYYLLLDWRAIGDSVMGLLPVRWRHPALMFAADADRVLGGVIRGQVTIAVVVGVSVSAGLYLLGVRFALLIGILAGLLDIIPYFGAVIGALPAVTLALIESPWLAVKAALLFLLVHQLEGTVIGPKIMGGNVGLHPLSVIFFLIVGGEIGGFAGMLLGVPLAAVGKVLVRHVVNLLV